MSAVDDDQTRPAQPGELATLRDLVEVVRELLMASGRDLAISLHDVSNAVDFYDENYGADLASLCADCGTDTTPRESGLPWEWYMVRHDLWRRITEEIPARYLCIDCLEHRLGRPLTAADFLHAPINNARSEISSDRLLARLNDHSSGGEHPEAMRTNQ